MDHLRSSRNSAEPGELTIALNDPAQLFNAPAVDPLSESVAEVLGISGVEHLLMRLRDDRRRKPSVLVLVLPADKAPRGIGEHLMRALRRYAESRIREERRALQQLYRHGWRVMGIALLVLAACLGLSSLFANEATARLPLARKTFEYGFEIIGWVMLWRPIEVLGFEPLPIRSRLAALRLLGSLDIAVRTQQTPAGSEDSLIIELASVPRGQPAVPRNGNPQW
jgi:hypothetical protein